MWHGITELAKRGEVWERKHVSESKDECYRKRKEKYTREITDGRGKGTIGMDVEASERPNWPSWPTQHGQHVLSAQY